jgi:glycosyltransferase involved in cell wall biosynthesis
MSKKINTIYITFNGIADPLGQSQVLPYLEDLSKEEIKIYLISLEKNIKKSEEFTKKIEEAGISWYRIRYLKLYHFGMILNVMRCSFLCFYLLLVKKIKIIHARSYAPLFSVFIFKKLFNFKLIFDMRGFWPEELADSGKIKHSSVYYKILKILEKKSILASDRIITLTPEAKEIIENNYKGKKTLWMPTCVDKEKFKGKAETLGADKFVMVYSGSLWTFYNMSAMAGFFKALKSKISNAHFLILGNNDTEKLRNLFKEDEISKNDYTILNLEPKEVPKYLLGADIGISFIYEYYSKKAAFPTKLAEYFVCGLPVVLNSQSDFVKKLVNDNKIGVILEKFDENYYQKAVDSLLLLLKNKDVKKRCFEVADNYLEKKICVNKYLDVYRDLK